MSLDVHSKKCLLLKRQSVWTFYYRFIIVRCKHVLYSVCLLQTPLSTPSSPVSGGVHARASSALLWRSLSCAACSSLINTETWTAFLERWVFPSTHFVLSYFQHLNARISLKWKVCVLRSFWYPGIIITAAAIHCRYIDGALQKCGNVG